MADQPRWPEGTPVAPSGKGPGGGRWRDDGKPNAPRPSWEEVAPRVTGRAASAVKKAAKATPTKRAVPAKKAVPTKKAAPAKKAVPPAKTAPAKKTVPPPGESRGTAPPPDWAEQVSTRLAERIAARTAPTSPDLQYHIQQGLWYESLEQHQAAAWEGRLTRDQADRGMREWAGNKNGYQRISELLRTRPPRDFKPTPAQRRSVQAIGHIDSVFADEATTTPVDLEVARGLSAISTLGMDLSDGAEFAADGYTAASFHEGWARSFTADVRNDGALFRIRIPAGSRVLAAGVGSGDTGDVSQQARHESEVLLPRGTRFRVVRRLEDIRVMVHGRRTDTVPVYEIEVVQTPHPSEVPLPAAYRQIIDRTRSRAVGAGGGVVGEGRRHMPRPRDWSVADRSAALEVLGRLTREYHGEAARLWWGGWDHRVLTAEQVEMASAELNIDLPSLRAFIRSLQ